MNNKYLAVLPLAFFAISLNVAHAYETRAPIAFMKDLSSGAVLFERQADKQIPPASMAKMMTVYVAFDQLKRGKITLDKAISIKPSTWRQWKGQGSTMFLAADDKPTIKDLLHGVITLSGNDASVVLAEAIAGTEADFAKIMTETAAQIGMKNSRFGNATGWPDEGKTLVTARDLTILGGRLYSDFPELYKSFFGLKQFAWGKGRNGKLIVQPNRNPILGKVEGADGLKTGHTEEAGFGFTGAAEQKGRRIISVLAGLDSYGGRITESINFMNWGFNSWETAKIFEKGARIQRAEVQLGSDNNVTLVAPRDLFVTFPAGKNENLSMTVRYNGPIKAPIKKGQIIASLVTRTATGGEQITDLVAGEDVDKAGFFTRSWRGLMALLGLG